ncbi:MAG: hypothetical protein U5Q44_03700 [Dehalococcoidia bacterium]|nr:hypothetical protein [Dehalococcoidia bacterium]
MTDASPVQRSDRVLPATRAVAIVLVPILTLAFIILFFQARNTGDNFAWTINPPMTAVIMASGYLGGAYYFLRVAWNTRWHETGVVLPAVSVFATVMFIATVLHWENFNHGHLAFWLWVFLYVAAPPLVFGLWWFNRGEDPREPTGAEVPAILRSVLLVLGVGSLLISLALLFQPESWSGWWPWTLSPLTGRIISGWFALAATASLLLSRERRVTAWLIPFEATFIWAALIGAGALRYDDSFAGSAEQGLFLFAVGAWLVGFGLIYAWLRRARPVAAPVPG